MDELDRRAGVVDSEPAAGEHLFVNASVEVREAFGELDLRAVDDDRTERRYLTGHGGKRQVRGIDRQEPAHACALKLDVAGHLLRSRQMDFALLGVAEQPPQK